MSLENENFFKRFAQVSKSINTGVNSAEIFASIVGHIKECLSAGGAFFWILDDSTNRIESVTMKGPAHGDVPNLNYSTLSTLFRSRASSVVNITNIGEDSRFAGIACPEIFDNGAMCGVSMDISNSYRAILAVWFATPRCLNEMEQDLLTAFAEQGASAVHKALMYDTQMVESLRQMVEGFALVLEAKDEMTHGHSIRVARFARLLAEELTLSSHEKEIIYHGGLLHDIGKIGLDDAIIERLGILSKNERNVIQQHPVIGARILRPLKFLSDVLPIVLHHHERFDGTGYPDGLKGADIPIGARVITVCDALETMLAGRKHMRRIPLADAIGILQRNAGSQFDATLVESLFAVISKKPDLFSESGNTPQALRIHRENLKRYFDITPSIFI